MIDFLPLIFSLSFFSSILLTYFLTKMLPQLSFSVQNNPILYLRPVFSVRFWWDTTDYRSLVPAPKYRYCMYIVKHNFPLFSLLGYNFPPSFFLYHSFLKYLPKIKYFLISRLEKNLPKKKLLSMKKTDPSDFFHTDLLYVFFSASATCSAGLSGQLTPSPLIWSIPVQM